MCSVGKSIPHDSARQHVTGEATYIDDYVPRSNELIVQFVGSPCAAGCIESIDIWEAQQLDGIEAVFTSADITGVNHFGPVLAMNRFWRPTK